MHVSERTRLVTYWTRHCRACGTLTSPLVRIDSKILGQVMLCYPCAGRVGLLPTRVAEEKVSLALQEARNENKH